MIFILMSIASQGFSTSQVIAFILAYVLALVIAFGLHEFSHAFIAYKLGDPTPKALGRLTLNPFKHMDMFGLIGFLLVGFGWAKPVPINPLNFKRYKRDTFFVSISGVVCNLLLAFIFSGALFFFANNVGNVSSSGLIEYQNSLLYFLHFFFEYSVILNIALFVFNLLPIYPLDGFNAVRALTKVNNKFVDFMFRYGNIIMLLIIITPVFDWLYGVVTNQILDVFMLFWGLFV